MMDTFGTMSQKRDNPNDIRHIIVDSPMERKQREELKKNYKPKNLDPTYRKNRRKFVEYLSNLGNDSKADQIVN